MFSRTSGLTIFDGQFNNIQGDQVDSVGYYALMPLLSPNSIQFRFGTERTLIESVPAFLFDQLSDLALSLDLSVVELLLLLAYHSFASQLLQSISNRPLYQLLN
ncbi:hypothetical protein MPER_08301 [Moniliophthora perniciosa FA553]|nr:hypothetical protein MPER_08301 [Moniliophthora perniciosa FA553]